METHFKNIEHTHSVLARERVRADFNSLIQDAEDLLRATASDATGRVKEARERLTHAVKHGKETCEALQEQTVAAAKEAAATADRTVRSHPYESMGIAAGIGFVIGLIIARK